jgi:hypothetical protein
MTAISGAMVLPGLAGYWLDQRLKTGILFILCGFAFGLTAGIWQLARLTHTKARRPFPPTTGSKR